MKAETSLNKAIRHDTAAGRMSEKFLRTGEIHYIDHAISLFDRARRAYLEAGREASASDCATAIANLKAKHNR